MSSPSTHLSDLWKLPPNDRQKGVKLLSKIFNNILSDPSDPKYRNLNFSKIRGKLNKCRPCIHLLFSAGFKETTNGTRLQWEFNDDNLNSLKSINVAMHSVPKAAYNLLTKVNKHNDILDKNAADLYQQKEQRNIIKQQIEAERKEQNAEEKSKQQHHQQQYGSLNVIKSLVSFEINNYIESQLQTVEEIIELLNDGHTMDEIKTAIQLSNPYNVIEDNKNDVEQSEQILQAMGFDTQFIPMALKLHDNNIDGAAGFLSSLKPVPRFKTDERTDRQPNKQLPSGLTPQYISDMKQTMKEHLKLLSNQVNGWRCYCSAMNKMIDEQCTSCGFSPWSDVEQSKKCHQFAQECLKEGDGMSHLQCSELFDTVIWNCDVDKIKCICGKSLMKVNDCTQLYGGSGAVCDKCNVENKKDKIFFHCDKNNFHPNGYDLCEECCSKQQATSKCELSRCSQLERICKISTRYRELVLNNDDAAEDMKIDFDTLYDKDYNNTDLINDFNHLLFSHEAEFENIYQSNSHCDLSDCLMMRRNHRDRGAISKDDMKFRQTFFGCNDYRNIVKQQLLDKIHCYYCHSFDIGYKLTQKERNYIEQEAAVTDEKYDKNYHCNATVDTIFNLTRKKKRCHKITKEMDRLSAQSQAKFVTQTTADYKLTKSHYSEGIRYYYWDYYKSNADMIDKSMGMTKRNGLGYGERGNEGYMLCEWFIVSKFEDFKDELLNNALCTISADQWNSCWQKAMDFFNSDHAKSILSGGEYCQLIYEIQGDTQITTEHLTAMMMYCNKDFLQSIFSATYRRTSIDETDYSLKARHSNYAHFGRLLRECVECYGYNDDDCKLDYFDMHLYHGIDIEAQFLSIYTYFKGPVSTSTSFNVAASFCHNKGLILEFKLDYNYLYDHYIFNKRYAFFECHWLSDYPQEQEVFFIGGFSKFRIKSIIEGSTANEYTAYLMGLTELCKNVSSDTCATFEKTDERENKLKQQMAFRLLSHQLRKHFPDNQAYIQWQGIPKYIELLLDNQCNSIVRAHCCGSHDSPLQKYFHSLFYYDNGWIKLKLLVKIFPSIKTICLSYKKSNIDFISSDFVYRSILAFILREGYSKIEEINIIVDEKGNDGNVLRAKCAQQMISKYKERFNRCFWDIVWIESRGTIQFLSGMSETAVTYLRNEVV